MISGWQLNEHLGQSKKKKRIYEFSYKLKTASVNNTKMFTTKAGQHDLAIIFQLLQNKECH